MFFMRFQMCYNNIHKALGDIFMSHISLEVNHKHFRDLYLCFCGIHDCEPSHSFGPAIRPNYLLHFVIKGKGNYYLNDNCYDIRKYAEENLSWESQMNKIINKINREKK